ncbi:hypothetical protein OAO18_08855, partial [Francisellaceae bacterium]|nr:hypothetical protein [Francisellaceae bacterium]
MRESNLDKVHTTGLDGHYVEAIMSDDVTGTQSAAPNEAEYIVGIKKIEVAKEADSFTAVSIDDDKEKLKLKTQEGTEEEVMGQFVGCASLSRDQVSFSIATTGNVIQAINKALQDLKYSANTLKTDFYLKISGATSDQLTNSEGKTISAFMVKDDDFIIVRMPYRYFLMTYANNVKGKTKTMLY